MKIYYVLSLAILLGGCQTTMPLVSTTKYQIVMPDSSMYNCPTIKSFPNSQNLTDAEVAKVIIELYKNNQICKNSIESIRKFLEDSRKTVNQS